MSAIALMLTSCDPSTDNEGPDSNVTAEELSQGFTIKAKREGNNNLTISANPSRYIWIYTDEGEFVGSGTTVEVQEVPPAGERKYYIETCNQDGTRVKSAIKSIEIKEFTDLPELFETLYGNGTGEYTECSWTWDAGNIYWGNGGYHAGKASEWENDTPGRWWGVGTTEELLGQVEKHSDTHQPTGEEDINAYMTLSPSGSLTKYDGNGKLINKGTVKINAKVANEYKVANLVTSPGAILFPFEINGGGNKPTWFEITYVSKEKMALTYPDKGAQGDWGEATFWRFKRK